MKNVIIFGATGDIGKHVVTELLDRGYNVCPAARDLDFLDVRFGDKITKTLIEMDPDIIINCAGIFGDNHENVYKMMNVNFTPNWFIINHYLHFERKPIKIVMVGSSSYKSGKKNYMLYSASKAALHNLWEGARDFFKGTETTVNIVHPVRVRTKMVAPYDSNLDYLDPRVVACEIVDTAETTTSSCKELSFEEYL